MKLYALFSFMVFLGMLHYYDYGECLHVRGELSPVALKLMSKLLML